MTSPKYFFLNYFMNLIINSKDNYQVFRNNIKMPTLNKLLMEKTRFKLHLACSGCVILYTRVPHLRPGLRACWVLDFTPTASGRSEGLYTRAKKLRNTTYLSTPRRFLWLWMSMHAASGYIVIIRLID